MQKQSREFRIGDVFNVQFHGTGSEQSGWRPGLILQNNTGNTYSPNVVVVPLTSMLKKRSQPTHVFVRSEGTGLKTDSIILCENPVCISKERIGHYITRLPDHYMRKVAQATLVAAAAISFLDSDTLHRTWRMAVHLNRMRRPVGNLDQQEAERV